MKKHFKKNLIMTEEEEQFQSSNTCWIYEKLIDDENFLKIVVKKMQTNMEEKLVMLKN